MADSTSMQTKPTDWLGSIFTGISAAGQTVATGYAAKLAAQGQKAPNTVMIQPAGNVAPAAGIQSGGLMSSTNMMLMVAAAALVLVLVLKK